MAHSDPQLRQLAMRRYEHGRWRRTTSPALFALAVFTGMLALGAAPALVFALGAVALAATVVMIWRGQGWDLAPLPGLLAGGLAGAVALLVERFDGCCVGQDSAACLAACVIGGAVAGAVLTARALRCHSRRRRVLLGSGAIAALTAGVGCAAGGLFGLLGMLAALVALSAPVYWWRTARGT